MAEDKLRRKIRAEAALGSLSVGPPLAGPKSDKDRVSYTSTDHPLLLYFKSNLLICFRRKGFAMDGFMVNIQNARVTSIPIM